MTRRDDDLVRRYHEASELEDARPGAQVRDAVRAHAQMLATAAARLPTPAAPMPNVPSRTAANQPRWTISALATVAVMGLAGLLMLQFDRGTPEEKEIAYGQRRTNMGAPAAVAPAARTTEQGSEPAAPAAEPGAALATARPSTPTTAPTLAAPAPQPVAPRATPTPAIREAEAPAASRQAGDASAFPASPPAVAAAPIPPRTEPAPAPLAESHKRAAAQDASAASMSRQKLPAAEAAAPTAGNPAADSTRAVAPAQSMPTPAANAVPGPPQSLDLHNAARAGSIPQVESLIQQGAVLDARDSAGRTALMLAAMQGQTATVQKLLALGANPLLLDRDGLSAAQLARQRGHDSLAELIEAKRR